MVGLTRITLLGTADAFSGAGRANSAYWVDDSQGAYTIDFGPTSLLRCKMLGRDPDEIDGVLLTHLHGDHIGGLAVLMIDLQFRAGRTRPLVIAGPPGHEARVNALCASAFPTVLESGLAYPVVFLTTEVPGRCDFLGREVTAIRARHDRIAVASSLVVDNGERQLAFSGDTGWQSSLADLVRGVDLFLCECSSVDRGYWAHISLEEIAAHRAEVEVGRLMLTHLSEGSRAAAEASAASLDFEVADDGLVLEV